MKTKLKVNGSFLQFTDPLIGREPFETHGALMGTPRIPSDSWGGYGCLPQENWASFNRSTYAVYSYSTPIAWLDMFGDWIVPDVKYSVTTSKHQNKIGAALSWMGK